MILNFKKKKMSSYLRIVCIYDFYYRILKCTWLFHDRKFKSDESLAWIPMIILSIRFFFYRYSIWCDIPCFYCCAIWVRGDKKCPFAETCGQSKVIYVSWFPLSYASHMALNSILFDFFLSLLIQLTCSMTQFAW